MSCAWHHVCDLRARKGREEVRREEGKGKKKLKNQGGSGYERLAGF